jgi:hypothetical protein
MKRRDFLGFVGATIAMAPHFATAQQSAAGPLRILIIANRGFEADPLMAVLGNEQARHRHLSMPRQVVWPRTRPERDIDSVKRPRCVIDFEEQGTKVATIEVWCIEDLMSKAVNPSISDEKARVLSDILAFGKSSGWRRCIRNGSVSQR